MIDKRFLVDTLEVYLLKGRDDWGKPIYEEQAIDLAPVRFDRLTVNPQYSDRKDQFHKENGCVFVYTQYCDVEVDDSWLYAKIYDPKTDKDYSVISINDLYLFDYSPFGYELEVK